MFVLFIGTVRVHLAHVDAVERCLSAGYMLLFVVHDKYSLP